MEGKEEIWKAVVRYEGLYQVSNLGRVKSLSRKDEYGYNIGGIEHTISRGRDEKILKIRHDKDGYMQAWLCKHGKLSGFQVHRLVALSFIPNLQNKETVNHKNGIKDDNTVENLEWATISENTIHAFEVLNRIHHMKGVKRTWESGKESKSCLQISLDGFLIKEYESRCHAQRETGIHNANISACINGKHKHAGGYIWR